MGLGYSWRIGLNLKSYPLRDSNAGAAGASSDERQPLLNSDEPLRHASCFMKKGSVLDIGYSPPSFLWR